LGEYVKEHCREVEVKREVYERLSEIDGSLGVSSSSLIELLVDAVSESVSRDMSATPVADFKFNISEEVREKLYKIKPRTVAYLYSAGKDSSLALLLTRDFVRDLCREIGCRVYMLHIVIAGNSHPLNTYAASTVMEWHRKHYGFEPIYKVAPFVFQEGVIKWGLQIGPGRWCFMIHKDRILREIERLLPKPLVHVDGMSPGDSKARSKKIKAELELITTRNTWYWAWHPLFSLNLSGEEKLRILEQHEEFRPIVEIYREYGDSLNCVLCPYKSVDKLMIHNSVENLSAIYYFVKEVLKSDRWRRKYSRLASRTLVEFTK
jgi:3'-phosphoadenosine 5'-phosphosulfate sulfotransferase (PAPS reductase)/FAD synthetase